MNKMTVRDIEVTSKKVLVRVDFNVPLDIKTGEITDDSRIIAALPTIDYLIDHDAKVILCSHLGRPNGKVVDELSLAIVANRLSKILRRPVKFVGDCIGHEVEMKVKNLICKDVLKENLINKKLQDGFAYLLDDENIDQALDIYSSFIQKNYRGIIISRQIDDFTIKYNNTKIFNLSLDKKEGLSTISSLNQLEKIIENNIKKHKIIIILDRIDFFLSIFPFNEIIKTFYRINDLIKNHKSILILRINSKLLNESELSLFNEEYIKLKSDKIFDIIIRDDLIDIIKYIENENKMNINVTFGDIGKKFNISKVTVKSRIETLINKDLIYSKKIGKTKILYLTELGEKVL